MKIQALCISLLLAGLALGAQHRAIVRLPDPDRRHPPRPPARDTASRTGPVTGPLLGYAFDASSTTITPILGLPGAAILGQPLKTGLSISRAEVSPNQDYFLVGTGEGVAVLKPSGLDSPAVLAHLPQGAGAIALSPAGTAAAVYYKDAQIIRIVAGLPGAASLTASLDASALAGGLAALAVNDSGLALAAASGQPGSLYQFRDGRSQLVAPALQVSAIAFFPNGRDAVLADSGANQIDILQDAAGGAALVPLAGEKDGVSAPVAVATSRDGRKVLAAMKSGDIAIFDLGGGPPTMLSCRCAPTGLYRLSGNSVFRLTEASEPPVFAVDGDSAEPRVVFIPAVLGQGSNLP